MPSRVSPGIVNVTDFVAAHAKKFGSYINYIDRDEAIRIDHFDQQNILSVDGYNHYMENPKKSSGIFTDQYDHLTPTQRTQLKKQFTVAQKHQSVMWQSVFSFRNDFLAENNVYNPKTKQLDEAKLRDATRVAMNDFTSRMGMAHSAIWSAAIHRNTDNIHIHVAVVEPQPTREWKRVTVEGKHGQTYQEWQRKGYVPKKILNHFKAAFANEMVDRDRSLARISELIRQRLQPDQRSAWRHQSSLDFAVRYQELVKSLPRDRRLWKYNNNAMQPYREQLDAMSRNYLMRCKPEELGEFKQLLTQETRFREALYGSGTKEANRAQDYTDNKLHELYARMGNSILKDISAYRSEQEEVSKTQHQPSVANHLNGLQKIFNADIKGQRLAKREYQRRQADQDREREQDKKKQEQQTRFY